MYKVETEYKYTVSDSWRDEYNNSDGGFVYKIIQGYLSRDPDVRVRLEIAADGSEEAYMCVKGKRCGNNRWEYWYEIPVHEARMMLVSEIRGSLIVKTRYTWPFTVKDRQLWWEVDVFDEPKKMTICELEIPENSDIVPGKDFPLPGWIKEDVTSDESMYNHSISKG